MKCKAGEKKNQMNQRHTGGHSSVEHRQKCGKDEYLG